MENKEKAQCDFDELKDKVKLKLDKRPLFWQCIPTVYAPVRLNDTKKRDRVQIQNVPWPDIVKAYVWKRSK